MNWSVNSINTIGRSASSLKKELFNSGKPELDRYLKQYAKKNDERGIARTFVAFAFEESQAIAGYYSCCASAIDSESLPSQIQSRLPRYPTPAILIGKLAVDLAMQGRGLGKFLLFHGFENAIDVSQKLGVYAVRVDAVDEEAKRFYQKYGFMELEDAPLSLFISIETIKQAWNLNY